MQMIGKGARERERERKRELGHVVSLFRAPSWIFATN
jgi:hypothetical protein